LERLDGLCPAPLPDGSNIVPLRQDTRVRRSVLTQGLRESGIVLPSEGGSDDMIPLTINTTILRQTPDDLRDAFADALGKSIAPAG
jgi:hypothetical protein